MVQFQCMWDIQSPDVHSSNDKSANKIVAICELKIQYLSTSCLRSEIDFECGRLADSIQLKSRAKDLHYYDTVSVSQSYKTQHLQSIIRLRNARKKRTRSSSNLIFRLRAFSCLMVAAISTKIPTQKNDCVPQIQHVAINFLCQEIVCRGKWTKFFAVPFMARALTHTNTYQTSKKYIIVRHHQCEHKRRLAIVAQWTQLAFSSFQQMLHVRHVYFNIHILKWKSSFCTS